MDTTRYFKYYDDWRSVELECPKCGWKGKFKEGAGDYYSEYMDCLCPRCPIGSRPVIAIVSYPTIDEMLASGDPEAVRQAEKTLASSRAFEAAKLVSKEQLPEIEEDSFVLAWDFECEANEKNCRTLIRHGQWILFSEPARWEGFRGRFEDVCRILRDKYGSRVRDLVPTSRSYMYLLGDSFTADKKVERIRREVFGAGNPDWRLTDEEQLGL